MAHRHDAKERRGFGTTPSEVVGFLLYTAITKEGVDEATVLRQVKARFSPTNFVIEIQEPLDWLLRKGYVRKDGTKLIKVEHVS